MDNDRKGDDIFLWMWEEKCSSPCQACWKLCRQVVYFVLLCCWCCCFQTVTSCSLRWWSHGLLFPSWTLPTGWQKSPACDIIIQAVRNRDRVYWPHLMPSVTAALSWRSRGWLYQSPAGLIQNWFLCFLFNITLLNCCSAWIASSLSELSIKASIHDAVFLIPLSWDGFGPRKEACSVHKRLEQLFPLFLLIETQPKEIVWINKSRLDTQAVEDKKRSRYNHDTYWRVAIEGNIALHTSSSHVGFFLH